MRHPHSRQQSRLLVLAALALLAAPATAQTPPRSTADQAASSAERVVTQPLRDLNISGEGISPELEAMMKAPYSLKGLRGCADYKREIDRITKLIGPDVDSAEARAASVTSTEFVLGTAESAITSLIPGRGIIRQLSGATAAEKRARAATLAASLRRAFLKGRGSALNCRF
jgi:hypothetical protein